MTLQLSEQREPPYRFGVRRKKNKNIYDGLEKEWNLKVQQYPYLERTCTHAVDCNKYGCTCTPIRKCDELDEKRDLIERRRRGVATNVLTDKERKLVERYQREKKALDDLLWGEF